MVGPEFLLLCKLFISSLVQKCCRCIMHEALRPWWPSPAILQRRPPRAPLSEFLEALVSHLHLASVRPYKHHIHLTPLP